MLMILVDILVGLGYGLRMNRVRALWVDFHERYEFVSALLAYIAIFFLVLFALWFLFDGGIEMVWSVLTWPIAVFVR